ncbi:Fic family protein [Microbacterium sp. MEC084]|nr:Fic family protein [Microbacterium sp. MEC084]
MDGRFGSPYNHVAYVADPLGDEPPLESATWRAVNEANRALARLDQASSQVPSPDLLRRPTLRREAQSTSALEGTFAPLEQVLGADTSDEKLSKELVEVLNYVEAASVAFNYVAESGNITVGLLETCQKVLVRGTDSDTQDAGRVRTTPVAIGSPTGSIEDARFVPMPPGVELRAAIGDLIDWIRSREIERDPIVAAALAHYQFETLHPFNDGNGRIGRLLVVLHFMVDGVLREPLLSVSPWFEARKTEYQDHLASVSATGRWDPWIRFFAEGIAASATDTALRVDRLLSVQRRYVELLQEAGSKGVIRDIADILIGDPLVTVPMLTRRFGKAAPTVNAALERLVSLGILSGPIGTYNRRFIARDIWAAVTAPPGAVAERNAPLIAEGA